MDVSEEERQRILAPFQPLLRSYARRVEVDPITDWYIRSIEDTLVTFSGKRLLAAYAAYSLPSLFALAGMLVHFALAEDAMQWMPEQSMSVPLKDEKDQIILRWARWLANQESKRFLWWVWDQRDHGSVAIDLRCMLAQYSKEAASSCS